MHPNKSNLFPVHPFITHSFSFPQCVLSLIPFLPPPPSFSFSITISKNSLQRPERKKLDQTSSSYISIIIIITIRVPLYIVQSGCIATHATHAYVHIHIHILYQSRSWHIIIHLHPKLRLPSTTLSLDVISTRISFFNYHVSYRSFSIEYAPYTTSTKRIFLLGNVQKATATTTTLQHTRHKVFYNQ